MVIATRQPSPTSPRTSVARHLDAVEEDLVELGSARQLSQRPDLDARRSHVDEEHREPVVSGGVCVRADEQEAAVRDVRERRPDLLPVHDEHVVLHARLRAEGREVGAGLGLREALAPDLVGGEDRGEEARALRVGAVRDDRRPRHPETDHADVRRCAGADELLVGDGLEDRGEPSPAVLAGQASPA